MKRLYLIFFFLVGSITVFGQSIKGVVLDDATKIPMEFVSVIVKGTSVGVSTDSNGWFDIPQKTLPCTIQVVFVGYKTQEIIVDSYRKNLKVILKEDVESLQAAVVRPDFSYVMSIMQKVVEHKKDNNPERQKGLSYQDYNRTSVFLTNLDKDFVEKNKSLKKVSDALLKTSDTTVMMPLLISEKITAHINDSLKNIHRSEQKAEEYETIVEGLGKQVQGFVEANIATEYNFYDNTLDIVLRGFPSPITSSYQIYYDYYLADSLMVGDVKYFKIRYYPKSQKTVSFKGEFWVENQIWALTELKAELPKAANINFVSNFKIEARYQKAPDGGWFVRQQTMNFNLTLLNDSFYASTKWQDGGPADGSGDNQGGKTRLTMAFQKRNLYSIITDAAPLTEMPRNISDSLIIAERAVLPLNESEVRAFDGMEKLKQTPQARFVDKLGSFFLYGYLNIGPIDIGHSSLLYLVNEIEGQRFSLPFRTSEKLWKNFTIGGYLGYGFRNKEFAYGGNASYRFKSRHRRILSANFKYDYLFLTQNRFKEFIQENPFQKGAGNVISSITTFNPNPYLVRSLHADISFEYDINHNSAILVRPSFERYESNPFVPFIRESTPIHTFDVQSLLFDFRFSKDQHYDDEYFAKVFYNNLQPVFHFTAIGGRYGLSLNGQEKSGYYAHLNASVKGRVNLGPCYLLYLVETGGIIGNVPFPLLKMPQGSGDIGFAKNHYNLLRNASFASDLYLASHLSLNTGGVIFNSIPGLRRLNLREVFGLKIFYGGLLGRHQLAMEIPKFLHKPSFFPYMEGSIGITNIFKILRVDYCFRINSSRLDPESVSQGIKLMFELNF